jgi:hypothetical protein
LITTRLKRAFNSLKADASGDKAAQKVITTSTVPEIMEAGNVALSSLGKVYQGELLDADLKAVNKLN